ncbi:MAG: tRNA lysidine(34) synthetase TilS [Ilumatobacteraceae bacterium]
MIDELLARCAFLPPPGSPVTCAFSGGPDSTALLALAGRAGLTVRAVHVDHALRASSAAEADRAVAIAAQLGVTARIVRVEVGPGPNLQARARAARQAALPPGALTGHTADDRAETMLLNLLRGAALDGLAALAPGPTRPLLGLRRRETAALCAHLGLDPIVDPSNADPRFVRTRVRTELLPLLDDIAGRDTVPLLTRAGDVIAGELALVDGLASELDATDAKALAAAPAATARRAVRRWLAGDGYPPDSATIARVLAVACGTGRACELPGGRRVERHRQRLRIVAGAAVVSADGMGTSGDR